MSNNGRRTGTLTALLITAIAALAACTSSAANGPDPAARSGTSAPSDLTGSSVDGPGPGVTEPSSGAAPSSPTPSAAASPTSSTTPGVHVESIAVDGVQRTFRVYQPAGLPSGPAPLVVMLHGGFGSAEQAEKDYGWDAEADTGHFLVAYPDGLDHAWNTGGGCCGKPGTSNVDDVGFIAAMVTRISQEHPVDQQRIFATGMSNGAIMDYTLACNTTIFAAIGPNSGTMLGSCPHPASLSVLAIHGTADPSIPYNGGEGSGVAKVNGPAVPAVNATWRSAEHCAAPTSTTIGTVTTSTATCPGGRTVELITIDGAGHSWPGGKIDPTVQRITGKQPPSTAINATRTIWAFFAAHPKSS